MYAPEWVGEYIGLPFKPLGRDRAGLDCWGLVRLVYRERYGIDLPAYVGGYDGISRADAADIAALIADGSRRGWREVPAAEAWEGDAVLLRCWGQPLHIGVLVCLGVMLHVIEGRDASLARLDGPEWRRRLIGYFRYEGASGRPSHFGPAHA